MLAKERQSALAGSGSTRGVVGAAVVTVETMHRVVQSHFHRGLGFLKGQYAVQWNGMVLLAKVRQHRAPGLAHHFDWRGHAATVIGHRCADASQQACGAPGEKTTPAIAQYTDLASRSGVVNGGLNVL